jgi:hypothetical protein
MQTRPLSANKQQRCFVGIGSSQDSYPAFHWLFFADTASFAIDRPKLDCEI